MREDYLLLLYHNILNSFCRFTKVTENTCICGSKGEKGLIIIIPNKIIVLFFSDLDRYEK